MPLPPYPFETVRLWIEPGKAAAVPAMPKATTRPTAAAAPAAIAEVWRDVLGLAEVGPDDDFLALGGDSLIAVRVAARLRERLGCEISAEAIFRGGTVAGLAGLLGSAPAPAREEGLL